MNKRMTALAVATLSSLTLLGCNSDSNDDSELSNNNTGDTLILTNDGDVSHLIIQLLGMTHWPTTEGYKCRDFCVVQLERCDAAPMC